MTHPAERWHESELRAGTYREVTPYREKHPGIKVRVCGGGVVVKGTDHISFKSGGMATLGGGVPLVSVAGLGADRSGVETCLGRA
jgi:hypothetical protein